MESFSESNHDSLNSFVGTDWNFVLARRQIPDIFSGFARWVIHPDGTQRLGRHDGKPVKIHGNTVEEIMEEVTGEYQKLKNSIHHE